MAEELVMIRKDTREGAEVHNGVYAILQNIDDALTEPQIRTAMILAASLLGHDLPANYFDESTIANGFITVAFQNIVDGPMEIDLDTIVFGPSLEASAGVDFIV